MTNKYQQMNPIHLLAIQWYILPRMFLPKGFLQSMKHWNHLPLNLLQ